MAYRRAVLGLSLDELSRTTEGDVATVVLSGLSVPVELQSKRLVEISFKRSNIEVYERHMASLASNCNSSETIPYYFSVGKLILHMTCAIINPDGHLVYPMRVTIHGKNETGERVQDSQWYGYSQNPARHIYMLTMPVAFQFKSDKYPTINIESFNGTEIYNAMEAAFQTRYGKGNEVPTTQTQEEVIGQGITKEDERGEDSGLGPEDPAEDGFEMNTVKENRENMHTEQSMEEAVSQYKHKHKRKHQSQKPYLRESNHKV